MDPKPRVRLTVFFALLITSSAIAWGQAGGKPDDRIAKAQVCVNRSKVAADNGNWRLAIHQQEEAYQLRTAIYGQSHLQTVACLRNLGWLELQNGDPHAASKHYELAANALKSSKPSEDADQALMQTLHAHAWALHLNGAYSDAAAAYTQALRTATEDPYFMVILKDALKLFEDMAFDHLLTPEDVYECRTLFKEARNSLAEMGEADLAYELYAYEAQLLIFIGWRAESLELLSTVVREHQNELTSSAGLAQVAFMLGHLKIFYGDFQFVERILGRFQRSSFGNLRSYHELMIALRIVTGHFYEAEQSLRKIVKLINAEEMETAQLLKIASLYGAIGKANEGIAHAEQAVVLAKSPSERIAANLVLFDLHATLSHWDIAEQHLNRATDAWLEARPTSEMKELEIAQRQSQVSFKAGRYTEAHQILVAAVQSCEELEPVNPFNHAIALKNLAETEMRLLLIGTPTDTPGVDDATIIGSVQAGSELTEPMALATDPDKVINNPATPEASVHGSSSELEFDYANAQRHLEQALSLLPEDRKVDPTFRLSIMEKIGVCLERRGKLIAAAQIYRKAMIQSPTTTQQNLELQQRLAFVHALVGDYPAAQQTLDDMDALFSQPEQQHDLTYAKACLVGGVLSQLMGEYVAAEDYFRGGMAVFANLKGNVGSSLELRLLNGLGRTYLNLHMTDKATELFSKGAIVSVSASSEATRLTADALLGLSTCHRQNGKLAEAANYAAQAVQKYSSSISKRHPDYAAAIEELAICELALGKHQDAISRLRDCVKIRHEALDAAPGQIHPDTARAENHLAAAYITYGLQLAREHERDSKKQYQAAIELLAKAERQLRGQVELSNPSLCLIQSNMALALQLLDRDDGALRLRNQSFRGYHEHLGGNLTGLSEAEQISFLHGQFLPELHEALAYVSTLEDSSKWDASVVGWLLNFKGVLNEIAAMRTMMQANTGADEESLLRLGEIRIELAKLAVQSQTRQAANHRNESQQVTLRSEEAKIIRDLGREQLFERPWREVNEVADKLADNELAIDFFVVWMPPSGDQSWEKVLIATVTSRSNSPQVFQLGAMSEVEVIFDELRSELSNEENVFKLLSYDPDDAIKNVRTKLSELYSLLLKPMATSFDGVDTLIISPDDLLWFVPWSSLVQNDRYLIEDFTISTVVSMRELITEPTNDHSVSAPMLVFNPDYAAGRSVHDPVSENGDSRATAATDDLTDPVAEVLDANNSTAFFLASGGDRLRSRRASLPDQWNELPGTQVEAERIEPYLRQVSASDVQKFSGVEASEMVIRNAQHPKYLLIGTHGYFHTEERFDHRPAWVTPASDQVLSAQSLGNCGLAMAGANHAGDSNSDEDGLLLGLEVLSSDLRGTELVVLSACETGLGDSRNGEGVAGLRQSFHLAGAQRVMSSLWSVSDTSTSQLMEYFWQEVAGGQSYVDSLSHAKRKMLQIHGNESESTNHKFVHPFFWAAFEISGRTSNKPR